MTTGNESLLAALKREDNPRLLERPAGWQQFGHAMTVDQTPICTECGDWIPDAPFIGALVCEWCLPFVPESERWL